ERSGVVISILLSAGAALPFVSVRPWSGARNTSTDFTGIATSPIGDAEYVRIMRSDLRVDVSDLSPLEQTALLTQYARALDSRLPRHSRKARPILGDTLADDIVSRIDYDFAALGVPTSVVCQSALRAKMLDDRVRAFTAEHPNAVVVDLGAGLDTGLFRVN